tara:strand:- start:498 stop:692 length:195 start_codon:yes stop_codon:yes gene_type:complete
MKLYELTDKGRALLAKPRHPEPTNWEHCCSCCVALEKELKEVYKELADERAAFEEEAERWYNHG